MKFILDVPSLEHVAFVKIAVNLWKTTVQNTNDDYWIPGNKFLDQWSKIELDIDNRIDVLTIPTHLKQPLRLFVAHIGRALWDWLIYLTNSVLDNFSRKLLIGIIICAHWTAHGRLDATQSARILSQSHGLSLVEKFDISCMFRLQDQVEDLWDKHSNELNKLFSETNTSDDLKFIMRNFWSDHSFKIDPNQVTSDTKSKMCCKAVEYDNQSALEFFWTLMTDDERNNLINNFLQPESDFDTLIDDIIKDHDKNAGNGDCLGISIISFLLAQLSTNQIDAVLFSEVGTRVYIIFLFDFLLVEFFTPTINHVLKQFTHEELYVILTVLVQVTCWKNCRNIVAVKDCLTNLLINAPTELKIRSCERVLELTFSWLFVDSRAGCCAQDLFNIRLLLHDAHNQRRVLSRCFLKNMITDPEYVLNWYLLEVVAKVSITSTNEMEIFKRYLSFIAHKVCGILHVGETRQWPKVDKFLSFCFGNAQEVDKFKKQLAFDYLIKNYKLYSEMFLDKFLCWCNLVSPEVRHHLVPDDFDGLDGVDYCFECCMCQDSGGILNLFRGMSVRKIRRTLARVPLMMCERGCIDINWDFVEVVARQFISTDEEMEEFKENCSCIAYHICTVVYRVGVAHHWRLIDKFLNFCLPNVEEVVNFKKSLACEFITTKNELIFEEIVRMLSWCGFTRDEASEFVATYELHRSCLAPIPYPT